MIFTSHQFECILRICTLSVYSVVKILEYIRTRSKKVLESFARENTQINITLQVYQKIGLVKVIRCIRENRGIISTVNVLITTPRVAGEDSQKSLGFMGNVNYAVKGRT